jgi:hypothetical protein
MRFKNVIVILAGAQRKCSDAEGHFSRVYNELPRRRNREEKLCVTEQPNLPLDSTFAIEGAREEGKTRMPPVL